MRRDRCVREVCVGGGLAHNQIGVDWCGMNRPVGQRGGMGALVWKGMGLCDLDV